MKNNGYLWTSILAICLAGVGCGGETVTKDAETGPMTKRLAKYVSVRLEADLNVLTEDERRMLPSLRKAAQIMDELFWLQAYGDKKRSHGGNPQRRRPAFR